MPPGMGDSLAIHENDIGSVSDFFQGSKQNGGLPEAEKSGKVGKRHRSADAGGFDHGQFRPGHDDDGAIYFPVGLSVGSIYSGDQPRLVRERLQGYPGLQEDLAGEGLGGGSRPHRFSHGEVLAPVRRCR